MIAHLDLVAELDFALVGFLPADQGLDQGGLARSVGPDHADAFAAVDRQAQVAEQRGVVTPWTACVASTTMSPERSTSSNRMTGPTTSRMVSTRSRSQSLQLALAVVGLLGALAGSVLADVGFELRGLLLLPLGLALQHLGLLGPQPPVLAVIAGVGGDPAQVQLPDLVDDLVEEIAVVAHDDHRDGLACQVAFEPFGRRDVEVVRRLVQEHQVGAFQQQLGEHHPRLLAAGERRRRPVELRLGEAEARQDLLDPVIDRVSILVLDRAGGARRTAARPARGRPRLRPRPSPGRLPRARAAGRSATPAPT